MCTEPVHYGLARLTEVYDTQRTWEVHDAVGSVRQVLNNQGRAFVTQQYDAWGGPPPLHALFITLCNMARKNTNLL
jgi:hypothetical protein